MIGTSNITMDKWVSNYDWETLSYGARLGNKYKNKLYRWPLTADMGLLYWRTDLMKRAPKTPQELIDISLKLKSKNIVKYGYVWQGRQYEGLSCVFLETLHGFGGEWLSTSQEVQLDNVEAINAAKWLNKLITSGASPKSVTNFSENEALQAFESGESALMRNWPYAWAELQKESSLVKDKVDVTTMVSIKDHQPISTLGSWGFSIIKTTKHKEAAYKVIKFLTSDRAQKELFLESGYTPTSSNLYRDSELLQLAPILSKLEKALSITKPRPQTPFYAQISDVLQTQISAILTDGKPVEQAMNLAMEKTKKIIYSSGS